MTDAPEFAKAPGTSGYLPNTIVGFGGVSPKFGQADHHEELGHRAADKALSEVRFFYAPDASPAQP